MSKRERSLRIRVQDLQKLSKFVNDIYEQEFDASICLCPYCDVDPVQSEHKKGCPVAIVDKIEKDIKNTKKRIKRLDRKRKQQRIA